MKLVDANLLLYAYDELSPHHESARKWLEDALRGPEPLGFAWQTLHAFLRISTHPRLYERPLSIDDAVGFVESWLAQPVVRFVEPGSRYWSIFRGLLVEGQLRRDLVMDAHLAALAIEGDATVYSADRDFAGFAGLRWVDPLSEP